jgi:hypothetical protein
LNCYVGIQQADYCTILVSLLLQLFSEILGHVTLTLREPLVMALKPAGKVAWQIGPACLDVSTKCQTPEKPMRMLFGRQRRWLMSTQRTLSRFASPRSSKGQTACWSRTKVTKHLWLRYLADLIWIAFSPLIPVFFSMFVLNFKAPYSQHVDFGRRDESHAFQA